MKIVILGPTAIGKTQLAIELAQKINGEIISADSMQIYKLLDIGTAKPTKEEQRRVRHHLIDLKKPCEKYSAGEFAKDAMRIIQRLIQAGKNVVIAGGTGFYIEALVYGLNEIAQIDDKVKLFFDDICDELGSDYLYKWLQIIDERWAKDVNPNDCQRVKRGLGVYVSAKKPLSSFFKSRKLLPKDYIIFVLYTDKETLKQRIMQRVKRMIEAGLIEETKKALEKYPNCDWTKAIGYKEVIDLLQGRIVSEQQLIDEIARNTTDFAKRQLTFFKSRFKDAIWIDTNQKDPLKVILNTAFSGHFF